MNDSHNDRAARFQVQWMEPDPFIGEPIVRTRIYKDVLEAQHMFEFLRDRFKDVRMRLVVSIWHQGEPRWPHDERLDVVEGDE